VRVVLDATPLLGVRTGIGRYVEGLLDGLMVVNARLEDPPDLALAAFTRHRDRPRTSSGAWVGRRVPARLLHEAWGRVPFPPMELIAGAADVVHGTNFVLPPRRRAAGVVTIHDLAFLRHADTVTPAVKRLQALVPRLLRSAQAVITPTAAVADQVAEDLPVPRDRIHPVHHGIDPRWAATPVPDAAWRAAHGLPSSYALFVGTLEPRKELPTLVAALRHLGDSAPRLVLAGPAGWGPAVDVPAGTVQLGWVDDDVLRGTVAGADVLVLPSRDEGFGLPALEALACGTPVVASDLPVLHEVLGELARYAPVGNAEGLAAALSASPVGSRQTRQLHAAAFTWEACARRTLAVYETAQTAGHTR